MATYVSWILNLIVVFIKKKLVFASPDKKCGCIISFCLLIPVGTLLMHKLFVHFYAEFVFSVFDRIYYKAFLV